MKIAYVITRSDIMGGASVHLLDLAAGAVKEGHQVAIYVGGEGVFIERARQRGLTCIPVKSLVRKISLFDDAFCFFELRSKLKTFCPDIIHLHSSKAGFIGRLVAKSLSVPSVFTAHGWAFTEGVSRNKRKLYLILERLVGRYASKIITVSEYDRRLALDLNVVEPSKLVTIHNGMPEMSEIAGPTKTRENVRFIMVARFDQPKDHSLLVRAFSHVEASNWELELVGDGPSVEAVRVLADELGLANKIVFSGVRNDVSIRLANSDVFCLISNWEGLPLTILEAMRGGLPVIASDVGGVAEAVSDGQTGYVVKRGDAAGVIAAIEALISSNEDRFRFGRNGRKRYEEEFTFLVMLKKTLTMYEHTLGQRL